MNDLTKRQSQALDFIRQFMQENGSAPTQREVADAIGCSSVNAATIHLQALERKGVLSIRSGRSRGIVLKANAESADFDTWLNMQTMPVEVDCACVTTEVLLYWVKKAYTDGLRAGASCKSGEVQQ
jgi:SOS-response transcriptional repressor LexA